jgi:5-methylcytosine-specific restriction endonuclease McrA
MPARIPAFRPPRLRTAARRDESGRPNAAARGYCDKAHRLWRQAVLNKCNWQCVDCKRVAHGREMHADHVVPISQGGARYDVANGEARCVNCHSRKTARESGSGGACGS